ncbi:hypothetical protein DOTSEDRAFT_24975 [Dothistroma septosporum NZE10]|uniref:Uncharacterized protein n=1 Tax=Dothistroma septosporum (strain NZE10 / CBS 128990) TaxID=675120 RepID=M2Y3V8_DOTSN|nr:hypothetical protein DOTSEDRAFT_24975 [Dothistroma septosporum NZE10]
MGIDRLYYWTAGLMLTSLCCWSTWRPFDGGFHRPKNQYVKERRKSDAAANKAEHLASEIELDGLADRARAKKHKYKRRAADEHDDEPAPRPSAKQDRRRSRAQTPGPGRRHKRGCGDDTPTFNSSSYSSSASSRSPKKPSARQRSKNYGGARVKPTAYSDYIPEAYVLGTPVPGSPLEPVNIQHRYSTRPKPSDFAPKDHKTGRAHRDGDFETYKNLYGGYDDQMHAPFEDDNMSTDNDKGPVLLSPAKRKSSSLHNRRVSASPEKFDKGHFEPLSVRTDLTVSSRGSPPKRIRANDRKIEVYYDAAGTPRIKATPTSVSAGLSPRSATFSPYLTSSALQPSSPCTTSITSGGVAVANRLLAGRPGGLAARKTLNREFSLLTAFVNDNALCILLVSYLPMTALISLYAISKTFHWTFNKHATAFVLSSMRTWAPDADHIFPWRCYKPLCIKDPTKRQKASAEAQGANIDMLRGTSRDVPSVRWLQMVTWREGVVRDMIIELTSQALRVPTGCLDAMKRMWFVLDLPRNAHRVALIRNKEYISDKVLYHATHIFLKIDMSFTDPGLEPYSATDLAKLHYPQEWLLGQPVGSALREHLLMERSLTPLWRVIRGWNWNPDEPIRAMTDQDIVKLWMRRKAVLPPDAPAEVKAQKILGEEIGAVPQVGYERVYRPEDDPNLSPEEKAKAIAALPPPANRYPPRPLLTPDDLIMREAVRRQLRQHEWWIPQMLWGFVYPGGRLVPSRTREQLILTQRSNHFDRVTSIPKMGDEEDKATMPPPAGSVRQNADHGDNVSWWWWFDAVGCSPPFGL